MIWHPVFLPGKRWQKPQQNWPRSGCDLLSAAFWGRFDWWIPHDSHSAILASRKKSSHPIYKGASMTYHNTLAFLAYWGQSQQPHYILTIYATLAILFTTKEASQSSQEPFRNPLIYASYTPDSNLRHGIWSVCASKTSSHPWCPKYQWELSL